MAFSLKSLFAPGVTDPGVARLYGAIVDHARSAAFYRDMRVPDTPEGRYAMIALHAFAVMDRLGRVTGQGDLSQALFDTMFADFDRNLREMGVGDLGVGKKVKKLAAHFYAMAAACRNGLNQGDDVLRAALGEFLYGAEAPPPTALAAMAGYLRRCVAGLETCGEHDIAAGRIHFPEPPAGDALS